jgi:hypothetical protein
MAAGAERTIAKVRAAGVEVIEVPRSGGFRAATMELHREPGPRMGDR